MSEDLKLQQRVIDQLELDPAVNAAQTGVSVHDGVVTLSGHVQTYVEKHAAERAARRVRGVRAVAQEIEVHLPPDKKTADDEIAARAIKILDWDVAVPRGAIAVKVEHGIITLSGEVAWAFQRAGAEYDVRKLGGVEAVINDIRLRPQFRSEDVRASIRAAFERSAQIEAKGISIDVTDGQVQLSGKVSNWTERQEAERAAWSVPGVVAVDDDSVISRP
jgi:osmotically-inducible protein OsmY